MLATLPWELAPDLPWHVFTSPVAKWSVHSSFVIGEYLFIALAALSLVHALRQGDGSRRHLLAWVGALIAGTANDLIFMALPVVNTFWQAQGTIMITPRLPLYIPCVYICFMYIPLVSVWRLNLPPLARAALTGLCGSLFYAPYDIVGAKFLWWTWHDSDMTIAKRILGAPMGSTMWVITFVAAYGWLLNRVIDRDPLVKTQTFIKGLLLVAGLSSILMVLQITALQQLDGGVPGIRGLVVVILLYSAMIGALWQRGNPIPRQHIDKLLNAGIVVYFATLFLIGVFWDPQTQRSASLHQTYGACHVKATDITGHVRDKFLCAEDYDEDFTFACVDKLPTAGSEWYTVCGRAHTNYPRWLFGLSLICMFGILIYSYLLGAFRRPR